MLPRFLAAIDKPAVREQLRRFLTARGFDVVVAVDGLQCLAQLREGMPTLLVLGQNLLWGGGNGVLGCLLDEAPFQDVTAVLADGGHLDDILPHHRPLSSQCHRCPCGLHDMQGFLACLEDIAWQIDREASDGAPDLHVSNASFSPPPQRDEEYACDGSAGNQLHRR